VGLKFENLVMTFPIKKRIITGLFIDKTAAPFKVDVQIKDVQEGGQPLALVVHQIEYIVERCGNERLGMILP